LQFDKDFAGAMEGCLLHLPKEVFVRQTIDDNALPFSTFAQQETHRTFQQPLFLPLLQLLELSSLLQWLQQRILRATDRLSAPRFDVEHNLNFNFLRSLELFPILGLHGFVATLLIPSRWNSFLKSLTIFLFSGFLGCDHRRRNSVINELASSRFQMLRPNGVIGNLAIASRIPNSNFL
jgi:hypothetical protein